MLRTAKIRPDDLARPIDIGPLGRAQQLEQLGFLHISIQQPLGLGFASAIKLHPEATRQRPPPTGVALCDVALLLPALLVGRLRSPGGAVPQLTLV
jgi:hypothetical protein